MLVVLVTGPIGSGKSLVCKYLELKSYKVFNCDDAVKELYKNTPGLIEEIEYELGLKFKEISKIFEDDNLRLKLEAIVFPLLIEKIRNWEKDNRNYEVLFIESATALGHKCFDDLYDKVLLINSSYSNRILRNPNTAQRDKLQKFDYSKIDFVVENDSSINDLYNKIDNFICKLI